MNRLNQYIGAMASIFVATSAFAAGSGSHGGQTIPHNQQEYLRDLQDSSSCTWESGEGFASAVAGFSGLLDKIGSAYQDFKIALQAQEKTVRVCLNSAALIPIPEDSQNIFLPYELEGHQVAVRADLNDETVVFIDSSIYRKMPDDQKPYLWLHELSHAYLPFYVNMRAFLLRSFVKSIYDAVTTNTLTPDRMKFIIQSSQFDIGSIEQAEMDQEKAVFLDGTDVQAMIAFANARGDLFWHPGSQTVTDIVRNYFNLQPLGYGGRFEWVEGDLAAILLVRANAPDLTPADSATLINWILSQPQFNPRAVLKASLIDPYLSSYFAEIQNFDLAKRLLSMASNRVSKQEAEACWSAAAIDIPYMKYDRQMRHAYIDFANWVNETFQLGHDEQ